jgi:hypothetical protein
MFNSKKNQEYVTITGKVSRIGVTVSSEGSQQYVILLQGAKTAYISVCWSFNDIVALTQPNDLIEFITEEGYINIVEGSFVNKTLAQSGYMPFKIQH